MLTLATILETMAEVVRREKQVGIIPDPDIDTYMKVNSQAHIFPLLFTCNFSIKHCNVNYLSL